MSRPERDSEPRFSGFDRAAIQFLADLAEHNDRAWFTPRKADYERLLKRPMEALVAALADEFARRDLPLLADPKRSPFRIYRDTRFSRDKSPYKTHVAASFAWLGGPAHDAGDAAERVHGSGAYFNFQPGEMYMGGGMWMPSRERLGAFRRTLLADPGRVRDAIEDPAFVAAFGGVHGQDTLKRIPAGYPADHPLADLFRWKDVLFGRRMADDEVLSADLPARLADGYAAAEPVLRLLGQPA
jgi:uncharacterized protein (TIGR02453 family)